MEVTGRSLCTRALRLIGALGEGQTPNSDQLVDAFDTLKEMYDGWRTDRLSILTVERATFDLVSGTATYTIGDGGDFDRDRPEWLTRASIIDNSDPTDQLEIPIQVLTTQDWQSVALKSTTSAYPMAVYYDYEYPLGNLTFYPVPNVSYIKVALYCPAPLSQFADIDTTYDIPPGYNRAIRFNLGVDLAPEYGIRDADIATVIAKAAEYLGDIRRVNIKPEVMTADSALVRRPSTAYFNWLTGDLV